MLHPREMDESSFRRRGFTTDGQIQRRRDGTLSWDRGKVEPSTGTFTVDGEIRQRRYGTSSWDRRKEELSKVQSSHAIALAIVRWCPHGLDHFTPERASCFNRSRMGWLVTCRHHPHGLARCGSHPLTWATYRLVQTASCL